MKKVEREFRCIILLALLLVISTSNVLLFSQVTIGSGVYPNEGVLLDLKEFAPDANNITSRKGLILPRVKLKMLADSLHKTLGSSEALASEAHTGLIVYNLSDSSCPLFPSGVYVWNGSSWQGIGIDVPKDNYSYQENTDGTGIVTDYEGNKYTTKRFQSEGQNYNEVWMTQNLRSLKDSLGQWIKCPDGLYFNPALYPIYPTVRPSVKVVTEIPEGVVDDYVNAGIAMTGQSYKNFVSEFGMLYQSNDAPKICPKGWHLPTAQEWEDLLEALGGKASVGHAMKANNGKIYSSTDNISYTWGTVGVQENGFNALPAGFISIGSMGGSYFGRYVGFLGIESSATIHYNSNTVAIGGSSAGTLHSVRCVKDK